MPDQVESKVAAVLELPTRLVQAGGIVTLLILTYGDFQYSLFAVIISLIWVNITSDELPQELGDLRVKRRLFKTIGEWLGRSDGGEAFDKAYSDNLYLEEGVEAPRYDAVAKAKGLANLWLGLFSLMLQTYLVVVMAQIAMEYFYF